MTTNQKYETSKRKDMHHLVKRPGSPNWYVRIQRDKGETFRSTKTTHPEIAKARRDEILASELGLLPALRKVRKTIGEIREEHLELKRPRIKQGKRSTLGQYIYPWNTMEPYFKDIFVDDFSSKHWANFMAQELIKDPKRKFFNYHRLLTGILKYALDSKYISEKPKLELDRRREKPEEIVLWTKRQTFTLLKNSEGEINLKIDMAYQTGMRPIEINMLPKSYIDVSGKMIRLPKDYSKTGDPRNIPISPVLMLKIKRQMLKAPDLKTLFADCAQDAHDEPFQDLKKTLGYDNIFYNFRHTCAVNMIKAGVPLATACLIIGNDIKVFMKRYFKPTDSDLTIEMRKMWK